MIPNIKYYSVVTSELLRSHSTAQHTLVPSFSRWPWATAWMTLSLWSGHQCKHVLKHDQDNTEQL